MGLGSNCTEIIAFYLPQFFPIDENDKWWGKGFTEWVNVAKAKPLFKGHYQPRIPADLSFYDLRVPEVRQQQVELARKAGVTAFCYWHYWFGNGKRLLERVFDEVLADGKPDFPFCLGWANHSWYAKTWNNDSKDKLLIEQTYPGIDDAKAHFNFLLKAFRDRRYVKIDGKPFLFIFDPKKLPVEYLKYFNEWAVEAGFPGMYMVANMQPYESKDNYLSLGYSAVSVYRTVQYSKSEITKIAFLEKIKKIGNDSKFVSFAKDIRRWYNNNLIKLKPKIVDYESYYPQLVTTDELQEDCIPQIIPQWDHTPRSGLKGLVWVNSTPDNFYKHAIAALDAVKNKKNPIIILKSWNEWGEGNYMEPDMRYGHGYIEALRRALDDNKIR